MPGKKHSLPKESKTLEFKASIPEKSDKYIKTVVAFANTDGGRLIFGVEDGTCRVVGLPQENLFTAVDKITNAICDSCEPAVTFDICAQDLAGKAVIIVSVSAGNARPYYVKSLGPVSGTYVRVGATSRPAERSQITDLALQGRNTSYDRQLVPRVKVSREDVNLLCDKLTALAKNNAAGELEKNAVKPLTPQVLSSWGVVEPGGSHFLPSNAYALLTGQHDSLFAKVQCAVFRGTDRADPVDRREFSGSVLDELRQAYEYVFGKINRGMTLNGIYREDVYELPLTAIREAIANAIVHRNYLEPGNIQISLFQDRLEIMSPGALMPGVSVKAMKQGITKFRNPVLGTVFSYAGLIEMWAFGIRRILRACEETGLPEPLLEDLDSAFRITLYRPGQKELSGRNEPQGKEAPSSEAKKLLQVLCMNPGASRPELAGMLGSTPNKVQYRLNELKGLGLIRRAGTNQRGFWEILSKEGA